MLPLSSNIIYLLPISWSIDSAVSGETWFTTPWIGMAPSCVHATWIELQSRNDTRARVPSQLELTPKRESIRGIPRIGNWVDNANAVFLDCWNAVKFDTRIRWMEWKRWKRGRFKFWDRIEKIFLHIRYSFNLGLIKCKELLWINFINEVFNERKFKTGSRFNSICLIIIYRFYFLYIV